MENNQNLSSDEDVLSSDDDLLLIHQDIVILNIHRKEIVLTLS